MPLYTVESYHRTFILFIIVAEFLTSVVSWWRYHKLWKLWWNFTVVHIGKWYTHMLMCCVIGSDIGVIQFVLVFQILWWIEMFCFYTSELDC